MKIDSPKLTVRKTVLSAQALSRNKKCLVISGMKAILFFILSLEARRQILPPPKICLLAGVSSVVCERLGTSAVQSNFLVGRRRCADEPAY